MFDLIDFLIHTGFSTGSKGKDVRDMMHMFDVNITVPPQENHSDVIVVSSVGLLSVVKTLLSIT